LYGIGALVSAATAACHSKPNPPAPTVPVVVAPAIHIDAPISIDASGVVAPMQSVNVESQVTGAVVGVTFAEGQHVDSGAVLFKIDSRALEAAVDQAHANLVRDAALADAAAKDDHRYSTLAKEDYVTKEQADQMHASAIGAEAVVSSDSAALRSANVSLGFATVRSPIAGRAGKLIVRLGNVVSPSSGPLVVVNQLNPIMVQFPVLAQDLPLLRRAMKSHPLPVKAVASDTTNSTETGQLAVLDNTIDSLTGTVTGQAVMPNAHALFWPGQLVALTIDAGVQKNAVAVRTEAVMTGQKGNYVFVVDPTGKTASMRNVITGRALDTLTIVEKGLTVGERVVVDGQSRLAPGSYVTIVAAPAVGDTTSSTTLPASPAAGSGTPGAITPADPPPARPAATSSGKASPLAPPPRPPPR
jgi:multidrug efflux system membrane fusion protein